MINKLEATDYTFESVDLLIYPIDLNTLELGKQVAEVDNFDRGVLKPETITLPVYDAQRAPITYVGRLRDKATGQYVWNEGLGFDFFVVFFSADEAAGKFGVLSVLKNTATNEISAGAIYL